MLTYMIQKRLDMKAVLALYEAVEWTNYTRDPALLEQALNNSLLVIAAFDDAKLVGLLRAVGDGYSIIFVQDILVLPDYQRRGIGRQLMEKLLANYPNIYQLHLLTGKEEKTKAFYESLGFRAVDEMDCVAYTYLK
ncbi:MULTISPECIES: GNAT family N-acetyltransferase [unclassified Streptococcus]|uniref:GNAT family N-acetyltransferase n=1 Tax=unclassified Streptococcus TaxID=2608887 RepID=UPI001072C307|nr:MULTISPECIES: GNAT family N-acetyltransferase [unclassified Streptococcus]MBF0786761.1 GNAT family N-acetyltransferase [Streptococcus sp. 19428wC2_LYSM12]MCQ9210998.1 GNAT family N-acetyltransferase [Streptococcus sp. B01]MCQ9214271.1 GNAT family N-acetyltransferase [Streptococcus sp. O1]TFV06381.1 N-acetyltransferase [Streptococcus sp. LYSM12]